MRLLLVIDHFGSGGAQRQIVELACGLKRRGHDVETFVYHPEYDFFRSRLDEHGILVHQYAKGMGFSFSVVRRLRYVMRTDFDVVVSYLNGANVYAELARPLVGGPMLIVSERSSHHDDKSWIDAYSRRVMHMLATQVVTNSQAHGDWLRQISWLRSKVTCIYNGVDLDEFDSAPLAPETPGDLRLMAVGRVGPEKNVINLIQALALIHRRCGQVPRVNWVGARHAGSLNEDYSRKADELLERLPAIRARWRWLGVRSDIPQLLREHHALIHPSLYEGLPNAVCEALAAARPVLVSNVCDHPLLVANGERGFLFDPNQPESIADAIQALSELDASAWRRLGGNARDYAVTNLGLETMITAYESLFNKLAQRSADSA